MLLTNLPQKLCARELSKFIPHSGPMVLLDTIEEWDDEHIVCSSATHRLENHPLKINNVLSSIHTIEYAAQAVSFHAALMSLKHNRPVLGMEEHKGISLAFLAVVRDFDFLDVNLSDFEDPLYISACNPEVGPRLLKYQVRAKSNATTIAQGQITLVIEK